MKKIIITIVLIFVSFTAFGQDNLFRIPSSVYDTLYIDSAYYGLNLPKKKTGFTFWEGAAVVGMMGVVGGIDRAIWPTLSEGQKGVYHNLFQPIINLGAATLLTHLFDWKTGAWFIVSGAFGGGNDLMFYGWDALTGKKYNGLSGFNSDAKHGFEHLQGWMVPMGILFKPPYTRTGFVVNVSFMFSLPVVIREVFNF